MINYIVLLYIGGNIMLSIEEALTNLAEDYAE